MFAAAADISGIVFGLDALGEVARRDGDMTRAARLAGAAEAHGVASGAGLGSVVAVREGWRSERPQDMSESAAWKEGAALPIDQAVAYALASGAELSQAQ